MTSLRQRPGDAEIDDPRSVPGQQHVRRLEIAVNDAGRVDCLQRLGDPGDEPECHRLLHRAVGVDDLVEGGPGHVRGHQPWRRGGRVRVDQLRGVQPAHPLGGLDLLAEAVKETLVVAEL
jgi:hypothetical protein